jgi:hypothetical protein
MGPGVICGMTLAPDRGHDEDVVYENLRVGLEAGDLELGHLGLETGLFQASVSSLGISAFLLWGRETLANWNVLLT